jgi:transcriptional/translational regulatory protein YebC/TACO1
MEGGTNENMSPWTLRRNINSSGSKKSGKFQECPYKIKGGVGVSVISRIAVASKKHHKLLKAAV